MPKSSSREKVLDAMANAMYQHQIQQVIKGIAHKDFRLKEFREFFVDLGTESDRALAVIAFTYIEARLEELLSDVLNPEIVGKPRKYPVFGYGGPLETAAKRINMAGALYWITPQTFSDLHYLRRIRNAFAHQHKLNRFATARIKSYVSELSPIEAKPLEAIGYHEPLDVRAQFHLRSVFVAGDMLQQLATAPRAIAQGLPPTAAIAGDYDGMAPVIKDIVHTTVETALAVLDEIDPEREISV